MPHKLNVGLSKKIGQPDYRSLGASCNVEVELDGSLLQTDLDGFHDRVSRAFAACRQAVSDELARHQSAKTNGTGNGRPPTNGNGARTNGNGNRHSPAKSGASSHRASAKQTEYIQQLAGQIRGLGMRKLDQLCQPICRAWMPAG
jgi:hypothetical protein